MTVVTCQLLSASVHRRCAFEQACTQHAAQRLTERVPEHHVPTVCQELPNIVMRGMRMYL